MKKRANYRRVHTALIIAFIAGALIFGAVSLSKSTVSEYQQATRNLDTVFATKGAESAYSFFKERWGNTHGEAENILAHWVGMRLYDAEGMEGLKRCDRSLNWGCYHGFFRRALERQGPSAFTQYETICNDIDKEDPRAKCFHDIGHVTMALAKDYSFDHLQEALKTCERFTGEYQKGECYGGVFTEYYFGEWKAMDRGVLVYRALYEERPYEPCNQVEAKYQSMCYYSVVRFWPRVLTGQYKKMEGWCLPVPGALVKKDCLEGVAESVYNDKKSIPDIITTCRSLSEEQSQDICLTHIAGLFFHLGGDTSSAETLCLSLSSSEQDKCLEKMQ